MPRLLLAFAVILPTSSIAAPGPPLLEFHLRADPSEAVVIVEVDNRSGTDICGYRIGYDGHWTPELGVQIRRVGRKPLKPVNPGYPLPPSDSLRIPPGHAVLDRYKLAEAYPYFRKGRGIAPGRWEARAFIRFHRCGEVDWQRIESEWERL